MRFRRCAKMDGMEEAIPESTPPDPPAPTTSRKLGFGALLTIALLGVNRGCSSVNASPSWIVGICWFALTASCLVILIWLWDHTNHRKAIVRIVLSLAVVVVMVTSTY